MTKNGVATGQISTTKLRVATYKEATNELGLEIGQDAATGLDAVTDELKGVTI